MIEIKTKSEWSKDYFQEFINVRNRIYQNQRGFIPDQIEEFEKLLIKEAPFNKVNEWKAVVIYENNTLVGRVFCSTRIDQFKQKYFLPFGYIEASSQDVFNLLITEVESFARSHGYKQVRGPIQGNVFNSSRFVIDQVESPFFTEPMYQKEYLNYMKENGFTRFQSWVSWKSNLFDRLGSLLEILRRQKNNTTRYSDQNQKIKYKIRKLDLTKWDSEMDIFYDLLMDSFSEFKDVEIITREELKVYLGDLRQIIIEEHCLILEVDDKPLGFICALLDLQIEISNLARKPSFFNKLKFLLKKKLRLGRILVLYIGKKKESEDKIKGIAVKLITALAKRNLSFPLNPVIFGYMQQGSRISSLMAKNCKVISSYGTFYKEI